MLKLFIRLAAVLLGAAFGYQWHVALGDSILSVMTEAVGVSALRGQAAWMMGFGSVILLTVAIIAESYGARWIRISEEKMAMVPAGDLLAGLCGLIAGLVVSVLLFPVMEKVDLLGALLPIVVTALLAYIGFRTGYSKKDDLIGFFSKFSVNSAAKDRSKEAEEHKILDTSVIIDGRIADICKTGFIEGTLVIPEFVLEELQHIADSSDLLKRNRGRRGLDILNKIQKELDVKVLIYEGDFEEISEVDSKLVRLAKALRGKVITNDFNLNKVCELQGVSVLNINDLANAVKPVVLPGEEIVVQVIKDGKEHGQGVAYLDDGTMIVVEGGREFIGTTMEVMVTSVLQTSAGRMIFAKPKLLEKAQ